MTEVLKNTDTAYTLSHRANPSADFTTSITGEEVGPDYNISLKLIMDMGCGSFREVKGLAWDRVE